MSLFDNRTLVQDCESNTDVSGETTAAPTVASNDAGAVIQGTNSIAFQVDDAQEVLLFDQDSAAATFSYDLTDATVYVNIKHNLCATFANLGAQIAMGDGADGAAGDTVGYNVAGADVPGFPYLFRYTTIKLDVSVIVASPGTVDVDFTEYTGTNEAALDHTAILQMGYGGFSVEKAVSTGKNAWCDGIYFMANSTSSTTGYALSIQGGSALTPETMTDVAADDITDGLGLVNNPKGSEYGFFAPTEWGDAAADSYFESTDTQWFWIGDNSGGHVVADTHFPFRLIGDSGSTNSWILTRVVIVGVSTRAQFYMDNADMDFVQMDSCTLIDIGAIVMNVANDVDKFLVDTVFVNCDQIDPGRMNMDRVTFNGSNDATGAMLLDEIQDGNSDLTELTFNSDGTGYGIRIAPTGAGPFVYNFDNWQNTGFGADDTDNAVIRIAPVTNGADITINLQNGAGTITTDERTPYTGTVTITNAQTIEANGMTEGAAVKFVADETVGSLTVGDVIAEILADSNGVASLTTFNYEGAFGAGIDIKIRAAQNGLPNAAVADDGAVLTDETTEANSSTDDDMTLTPDNPQDVNDAYYLGHSEQFTNGPNGTIRLKLEVTVAHTAGEPTITWEFWDGLAWSALTFTDTDPNPNFGSVGNFIYEFDAEGSWAQTTVNSQGPFYYVRARVSGAGTSTLGAAGRFSTLDVTKYLRQDLEREVLPDGLTTTVPWNINTIAKFDPLND